MSNPNPKLTARAAAGSEGWTRERVQLASDLWKGGKSASEIAAILGGLSRVAVIAKMHRMGLQRKTGYAGLPPEPKPDHTERDAMIVRLYVRGLGMEAVCRELGIKMDRRTIRQVLIDAGVTVRPPCRPKSAAPPVPKKRKITAEQAANREAEFIRLRRAGINPDNAAKRLGIGTDTRRNLERLFQAQNSPVTSGDNSTPKFAHDDKHVQALIAAGGFSHLSERRLSGDLVVACLPLVPFQPERRA